jgi:REP element-mobilizing transposase RayT
MQPTRLGEIYYDCPVYYLTIVTYNRNHILAKEDMQAAFIAFAKRAKNHGVAVGRYVIMPEYA